MRMKYLYVGIKVFSDHSSCPLMFQSFDRCPVLHTLSPLERGDETCQCRLYGFLIHPDFMCNAPEKSREIDQNQRRGIRRHL
jgi:hypothetical protein